MLSTTIRNIGYIFLLFTVLNAVAQVPRDTSYTPYSAYKKDVKKYPFIKPVSLQLPQDIHSVYNKVYADRQGRVLHFDAFYPEAGLYYPAVVLIHGGGWKSGDKSHMHPLAAKIAAAGYSCFCIEYRLSPEAKYPAGVYDVKELIKHIRENAKAFKVNPGKIAVLGCSSGGQMAALVGTTNGDKNFEEKGTLKQSSAVQAIIDMDGVLAFHHPDSQESEVAAFWLGGNYAAVPKIWDNASALHHAGKKTPPVLFISSGQTRFQAGREDMKRILNEEGIYNETRILPNTPHSFWFYEPWFSDITEYSTAFLDRIFKQN